MYYLTQTKQDQRWWPRLARNRNDNLTPGTNADPAFTQAEQTQLLTRELERKHRMPVVVQSVVQL